MPQFYNEYLGKIFNDKFNKIPKNKLENIGYVGLNTKRNVNEFLEKKIERFNTSYGKVKKALVVNDDQGKILDMHHNELLGYIHEALKTGKVDIIRKETVALKALVYEVGEPLPEFDFIQINGIYNQYDVEQLEKCQTELKCPTVKWTKYVVGQISSMPGTTVDPETGEEIEGSESVEISAATNKFREEERKKRKS